MIGRCTKSLSCDVEVLVIIWCWELRWPNLNFKKFWDFKCVHFCEWTELSFRSVLGHPNGITKGIKRTAAISRVWWYLQCFCSSVGSFNKRTIMLKWRKWNLKETNCSWRAVAIKSICPLNPANKCPRSRWFGLPWCLPTNPNPVHRP